MDRLNLSLWPSYSESTHCNKLLEIPQNVLHFWTYKVFKFLYAGSTGHHMEIYQLAISPNKYRYDDHMHY